MGTEARAPCDRQWGDDAVTKLTLHVVTRGLPHIYAAPQTHRGESSGVAVGLSGGTCSVRCRRCGVESVERGCRGRGVLLLSERVLMQGASARAWGRRWRVAAGAVCGQ